MHITFILNRVIETMFRNQKIFLKQPKVRDLTDNVYLWKKLLYSVSLLVYYDKNLHLLFVMKEKKLNNNSLK